MKLSYRHTVGACYLSYIVQAVVNNLAPLLFVTFSSDLGISLSEISVLITVNFAVQIAVDLSSAVFVDRIGYRASLILAETLAALGLFAYGLLPQVMEAKFAALLIAALLSAVGGGLIEVVVSPLLEALPMKNKASSMSLLHSFYSWGQALVILLSTVYFLTAGRSNWYPLPMVWAILPLLGALLFLFVPIKSLPTEGQTLKSSVRSLVRNRLFWYMLAVMVCSGASEIAMSQWASLFAEEGLGVSKTVGDLLGPCAFALMMGVGRLIYAACGKKMRLELWIVASSLLCIVSYLLCALSPLAGFSLFGCALCGLSVALLWPGTYSLGAKHLSAGGTAMFALFAFAGDIGCTVGPDLVGFVSDAVLAGKFGFLASLVPGDETAVALKTGMLSAAVFPLISLVFALLLFREKKDSSDSAGVGD